MTGIGRTMSEAEWQATVSRWRAGTGADRIAELEADVQKYIGKLALANNKVAELKDDLSECDAARTELKRALKAVNTRYEQAVERINDLKFELHQREYAVENSARLTELAAELRSALPDAYVDRHLVQCVTAPEGLLIAVIRGFETGRFGLYPETSDEWNRVLKALGDAYEGCYARHHMDVGGALHEILDAYDDWLDVPIVRLEGES